MHCPIEVGEDVPLLGGLDNGSGAGEVAQVDEGDLIQLQVPD